MGSFRGVFVRFRHGQLGHGGTETTVNESSWSHWGESYRKVLRLRMAPPIGKSYISCRHLLRSEAVKISRHSALSTQHSALSTQHSALSTQHSALSTQHSALSTLHSALCTLHSALSTQHSALCTPAPTLLRIHYLPCLSLPAPRAVSSSAISASFVATAAGFSPIVPEPMAMWCHSGWGLQCLLVSDPDFIEQVFITNAKQFIKHLACESISRCWGTDW